MENHSENLATTLLALPEVEQLHFYELLAHNLTVTIRWIWSDETLSDPEKIEHIKLVNEVLHRVTSGVPIIRLKNPNKVWDHNLFQADVNHYSAKNSLVKRGVDFAIGLSLGTVTADPSKWS
jgi:hypothetical protein